MQKLESEAKEWGAKCDKHGPYKARGAIINGSKLGGTCPQCRQDKEAQQQAAQERRQSAERARRIERLLGSAGIPTRFQGRTFENFRVDNPSQGRALKMCQAYAAGFEAMMAAGACVVMVGNPGTGKTHLATAVAHAVMPTGRSVHFTTVGRLLRHVKSTYSRDSSQTEDQALRSYLDPDLLILDEVGVQRGTEAERFILTEAIGLRYEHMKPMIVMGNCTEADLDAHLGDRLVSRLHEGGGAFLVFDWGDYRPQVHEDGRLPRRDVPPVDWGDGA